MYRNEFEITDLVLESFSQNGSLQTVYKTDDVALYNGDCLEVMSYFPDNNFDMIFADPPYNLSNNGVTCQADMLTKIEDGRTHNKK